jgi:hypothetical protein
VARWHYLDPALLWLYPAAYSVHVVEELAAGEGFRTWIGRVGVGDVSLAGFLLVNAIGLTVFVAGVAGVAGVARRQAGGAVAIGLATVVLVNAGLHLLGTLVTGVYSPGLVSGIVLYVPLGTLTLLRAAGQASGATRAWGVLVGLAAHALVSGLALSGRL